jgi:hypothetical protein
LGLADDVVKHEIGDSEAARIGESVKELSSLCAIGGRERKVRAIAAQGAAIHCYEARNMLGMLYGVKHGQPCPERVPDQNHPLAGGLILEHGFQARQLRAHRQRSFPRRAISVTREVWNNQPILFDQRGHDMRPRACLVASPVQEDKSRPGPALPKRLPTDGGIDNNSRESRSSQ